MIAAGYLIRGILRSFAIVALALGALFALFAVIEEAEEVGTARYGFADAFLVVALSTPATLVELSPFIALLGAAYGYGQFVRTQELVALGAAGMAPVQLGAIACAAIMLLFVVVGGLEALARPMLEQATLLRLSEQSHDGSLLEERGSWLTRGDTFVFVESLQGERPGNVNVFTFGEGRRLTEYLHAETATVTEDNGWRLEDGYRRAFPPDGADGADEAPVERFPERRWQPVWRSEARIRDFTLATLALDELWGELRELLRDGTDASALQLEFWRRCFLPLSGLAFGLLTVGFLLGLRPRSSIGFALLSGTGLALGLYLFQQLLTGNLLLAGAAPVTAVAAPVALVAAFAVFRLVRLQVTRG